MQTYLCCVEWRAPLSPTLLYHCSPLPPTHCSPLPPTLLSHYPHSILFLSHHQYSMHILSLFAAGLLALERSLAIVTPQVAPSPPSEGTGSTITSVVLQWTAPPLPLVLQDSPLIFILNYLFNGSNPGRSVILEVTNCASMYTFICSYSLCIAR